MTQKNNTKRQTDPYEIEHKIKLVKFEATGEWDLDGDGGSDLEAAEDGVLGRATANAVKQQLTSLEASKKNALRGICLGRSMTMTDGSKNATASSLSGDLFGATTPSTFDEMTTPCGFGAPAPPTNVFGATTTGAFDTRRCPLF